MRLLVIIVLIVLIVFVMLIVLVAIVIGTRRPQLHLVCFPYTLKGVKGIPKVLKVPCAV